MKKNLKIYWNAPITLCFALICTLALVAGKLTGGYTTSLLFSTYGSSLTNPLTYVRLIGHVFGHADFDHLLNNMLFILLLGPMLEEKYGDKLISVILVTALVTGVAHNYISPNVQLLGASGVVFAFILLASVTGSQKGIPLTLILVAVLWIGGEVLTGITTSDNISQLTHIIGGLSGAMMGMMYKS